MSYGLMYRLPFASITDAKFTIEIEKEGYTGEVTELTGGATPFTVEADTEEFIYTPTRFSTGRINVVGGDYLQELFSTDYRMFRVTLKDANGVRWCGFIEPELYTQDYVSDLFELEINCISAMSVLEYIDYKQQGEKRGFVSLWDLLKKCIDESRGQYQHVYVPHVYASSKEKYEAWENPLESMYVSEQNFFDEDDEPMTLKEVLEEIMKLLNWTCTDWEGDLYFIDADNEAKEYYSYNTDLKTWAGNYGNELIVQEIGFNDTTGNSYDILPGYNKAVVKCSNYPVGDALPDLSFDKMKLLIVKDEITQRPVGRQDVIHRKIYRPIVFTMNAYQYEAIDTSLGTYKLTFLTESKEKKLIEEAQNEEGWMITGAIPIKYDEYSVDRDGNADITDYNYTEQIMIRTISVLPPHDPLYSRDNRTPLIVIKGVPAFYYGGAFGISFNTTLLGTLVQGAEWIENFDFHFQLRIGNNYFHGKANGEYKWDNNPEIIDGEYDNNLWPDFGDDRFGNFIGHAFELINKKKLSDNLPGMKGYICKLPENTILAGDLELTIYAPYITSNIGKSKVEHVMLSNFDFDFQTYEDAEAEEDEDSDRIYENVVNEEYINPLDDIEFKISSYNNDGACYSKVLFGNDYLKDNLYCSIVDETIRPEEMLIRRIVNHYGSPKIKLTQGLKRGKIKPFTILGDNFTVNKKYMVIGGEIDYKMNRFLCTMIEI